MEVFSEDALRNATQFKLYEQEDDVTKDLAEFAFANAVYAALVEGHASEINSKRNAMDNASKNAGDMISNLNMIYNPGRQAAITNDLVDIITVPPLFKRARTEQHRRLPLSPRSFVVNFNATL